MSKRPGRREAISDRFWFQHQSGRRIYPYRSVERNSGRWAFRVAPPGTGANKTINQTLLDDVEEVYRHVFHKGWSVRLCDENGKYDGLYNKDGYSIVGTSEDRGRPGPTAADYTRVLSQAEVSELSRAFLVGHYYAAGRQASMEDLALHTGYDSFQSANLHYGRFAHAVADALPSAPADLPDGRYGNWTQALARSRGERNEAGHFLWTQRPEVASAMELLGWVTPEAETDGEDEQSDAIAEAGTERQALIAARRGQGLFRQRVLQYWGGRCAVTGCALAPLLVASHIKPWKGSTDAERLDGFNGLLLTPNLDRLFDRHLIGFSDDGSLLVSPLLGDAERRRLGVADPLRIERLHRRHLPYLKTHRTQFEAAGMKPAATRDTTGLA